MACSCGGQKEFYDVGLDVDPHLAASVTVAPENTGDGWNVSTPAAEGLETGAVEATLESIRGGSAPGVDSLLIARHGRLIAEGYFNGYGREAVHDLRSAAKSFVSALAGIAIDRDLFAVDDPIATLLPGFEQHANMDSRKRSITVANLLNMSSGLACNDWDTSSPGQEERMYQSKSWADFMLDLPMAAQPGTVGQYCTGGVVLLGELIAQRSGAGLDGFANAHLFGPLGIQRVVWRPAPDGHATAGTGMRLRPRDAAKLGALYLAGGAWKGAPVVPPAWVRQSQASVVTLGGDGYGLLWWKRSLRKGDAELDSYFAWGNGGNFVFVVPSLDLVVTFTGSNYSSAAGDRPFVILADQVLPAVH